MFVDCHAHLDMLKEKELEKVISNARKKKVGKIISCSTSFNSNEQNLEISKKFEEVELGIGLYPSDVMELNEEEIEKAFVSFEIMMKEAIAIGEVGLDYKYAKRKIDQEKQKEVFGRFVKLAKKNNKPLIIHSRFAQKQVIEILEEMETQKVLLHSFTDSLKLMKRAIENKWFVGIGLIFLKDELVQERIREIPLENILLETDSPIRFDRNKAFSEDVVRIAEKIAESKKIPLAQVEKQLEKNYEELFL